MAVTRAPRGASARACVCRIRRREASGGGYWARAARLGEIAGGRAARRWPEGSRGGAAHGAGRALREAARARAINAHGRARDDIVRLTRGAERKKQTYPYMGVWERSTAMRKSVARRRSVCTSSRSGAVAVASAYVATKPRISICLNFCGRALGALRWWRHDMC